MPFPPIEVPLPLGGPGLLEDLFAEMEEPTEAPGEVTGLGPVDAVTSRQLAGRLAASPGTRWCLTLTGSDGQAVAHGCARTGPQASRPCHFTI